MLIVMKSDATEAQVDAVLRVVEELGYKAHPMPGATRTAIGITGNQTAVDPSHFENMPGVADAIRVSKPYKLISLDLRPEKTIVRVGDATIGGDELAIIAGPCAIESRNQAFAIAESVRRSGARFFRGGAYKPRTSPYAFQGLGEEGLRNGCWPLNTSCPRATIKLSFASAAFVPLRNTHETLWTSRLFPQYDAFL